jgi:ribose transport system ATP-binding protein
VGNAEFFKIRNVSKSFPGVKALDDVSMTVAEGEVRALVGENGAGKSTLMKILNGNYKMDSGKILIDGKEVRITSPVKAAEYGISIIFQELNLVNQLSIAENIFAGRLKTKGKIIDWKSVEADAKELLKRIGFDVDPRTEVGKLSIAGKQMVEIAKALSYKARIILMDEPSATLTKTELDSIFNIIRDLKSKGIAVIYISHRLEEIFSICDSVTIMRDGKIIDTKKIGEITEDQIVEKMVGREINQTYPKREPNIGEEVLRVNGLHRKGLKAEVSFSLHKGEVLGIAGLVGAGRTETMRALYGVDYISKGEIYVRGKNVKINSPKDAKKEGIAFLTEDRKEEGLTIDFTVKSNIVMANLKKILSGGFLSSKKENQTADKYIKLINIKTPSRMQKVLNLSGGNQQKVVVAKWLNADSDIIIMDEPTRGIDVGAKLEIYELINKLVGEGKSVILISSDLPEVLGMSDRVLVMKDDSIIAELTGEKKNAVEVMRYAL